MNFYNSPIEDYFFFSVYQNVIIINAYKIEHIWNKYKKYILSFRTRLLCSNFCLAKKRTKSTSREYYGKRFLGNYIRIFLLNNNKNLFPIFKMRTKTKSTKNSEFVQFWNDAIVYLP